jgi:hypothetical protein
MTEGKPVELLRDRRGIYGIGVSDPYDIEALAWACGAGPRDTYRTPHVGNLILRPDMLQFGKQTSTGRVPPCPIASAVMPTRLGTAAGTPSIAFAEAGNASRQQDCSLTTAPRDYSKSAALVMRARAETNQRESAVLATNASTPKGRRARKLKGLTTALFDNRNGAVSTVSSTKKFAARSRCRQR